MTTVSPLCRPVTTRYHYRRPLLTLAHRLRRSQFAADVRRGWDRTLLILGCVGIAYVAILAVRGLYVVAYAFGAGVAQ